MQILQGIDLLKIERVKKIYLNYNNKFLEKILTKKEISQIKEEKKYIIKLQVSFLQKRLPQRH